MTTLPARKNTNNAVPRHSAVSGRRVFGFTANSLVEEWKAPPIYRRAQAPRQTSDAVVPPQTNRVGEDTAGRAAPPRRRPPAGTPAGAWVVGVVGGGEPPLAP